MGRSVRGKACRRAAGYSIPTATSQPRSREVSTAALARAVGEFSEVEKGLARGSARASPKTRLLAPAGICIPGTLAKRWNRVLMRAPSLRRSASPQFPTGSQGFELRSTYHDGDEISLAHPSFEGWALMPEVVSSKAIRGRERCTAEP